MGSSFTERKAAQSKHIRFTFAQDKRIEDACRHLGCTIQSFVLEATLERLAKVEAEQRASKELRDRAKKEKTQRREVRGLGLRTDRTETAPVVEPAPAPQIVVNVPAAATTTTNDVTMLASFVAKGSILERDSRLRRAHEILAASLDGDALDTAKKSLDAAVAALAPKSSVLDLFKK